MARPFDVTVFGATGFTGRQLAHALHAPERGQGELGLRIAVAGRSKDKLAALAAELPGVGVVVADATDAASVTAMCKGTRVVASTAGPFASYGTPIVAACVAEKTHYCDITGETPWIADMIARFHARAVADGTRLVPCCGYDSCPSDLGAWLCVQALRAKGEDTARVLGLHRSRGGVNGGSVASFLTLAEQGQFRAVQDPLLLSPGLGRAERDRYGVHRHGDLWLAPFVMGAVNTRIVRRSALLLGDYGRDFQYEEYWQAKGVGEAMVMSTTIGLGAGLLVVPPLRQLLGRFLPKPGAGPSEEQMNRGYYRARFEGTGSGGSRVNVELSGQGDPGNRVTVRFLAAAALSLACDPLTSGGGILTPAYAFGQALVDRVRQAGDKITVSG